MANDKKKYISQQEIAKELGISVPSVCRALKGLPGVSDALRKRVQEMAKKMNYHPNPFAISLRFDSPHIIGVIVPDIATHFFSSILKSIEKCAQEHGYFSIIISSDEKFENEKTAIQNMLNLHVDGIIACVSQSTNSYDHFVELKESGIPVVLYDRVCLPDKFSTVTSNDSRSAYRATKYLIEKGAKRIAFLGGSNKLNIVSQRKHGYLNALKENKIAIDTQLVICHEMEYNTGIIDTLALLDSPNPPDAILAVNDILAFSAMEAIKSKNLRIPDDIQLIGYTDEVHAKFVEPKLTAIRHNTTLMGTRACELLLQQIEGNEDIEHEVVNSNLEIRNSTR